MIGHSERLSLDVWLADGRPVEVRTRTAKLNVEKAKEAVKRYELDPRKMYGDGKDPQTTLDGLFASAKLIFAKDGYHRTVLFLLKGGQPIYLTELRIGERGHKYILMRQMADEVIRRGADGVILLGEIWKAQLDIKNIYRRVADVPERQEALSATLVTKAGEPRQLTALIQRDGDRVSLAEATERTGGAQFMFAPIYAAWGKNIPAEWVDEIKKAKQNPSGQ